MPIIMLKNVRLAFVTVFAAKAINDGAPRYSVTPLLPPDHPQLAEVEAAIKEVAKAKWGARADGILTAIKKKDDCCLHEGDTKAGYDGFEGNMFVSAGRAEDKGRPTVIDRDRTPLTAADGKPYSGCYGNVSIEIWAQDNSWGKRINADLRAVQFVKDGDAFASGAPAASADEFEDLGEGADSDAEFA